MKQLALLIGELNKLSERHKDKQFNWRIDGFMGHSMRLTFEMYLPGIDGLRIADTKAVTVRDVERWDGNFWEYLIVHMLHDMLTTYDSLNGRLVQIP